MNRKKIALITGAASGVGKALAKRFAEAGYDLIVVDIQKEALKIAAMDLEKRYSCAVTSVVSDLSKQNAVAEIFEFVKNQPIDALVNNAGNATYGYFADTDSQALINSIRLNIEALTQLTRLVLPGMIERRSGKILNVASTAAFQPGPLMAVYYASEAYVLSFSEALRFELKGTGISLTTLCPGPTATNFKKWASFMELNLKSLGAMSPEKIAEWGFRGLKENREIVIPGLLNELGTVLARYSPRAIVLRAVNRINTGKR